MNDALTCQHRPACSGCPSLETPYADQLEGKLTYVRQWFDEASIPDFESKRIRNILPSREKPNYRNRSKLVPRRTENGDVHLGLYLAGTHNVLDIPGCPVQLPDLNHAIEHVREAIAAADISIYNESDGSGDLRFVTVRQGMRTGELLVGVVTRDERCHGLDVFCSQLEKASANIVGVVQHVNPKVGNAMFGGRNITRSGRDYMEEEIAGLRIRLGLTSFFQVNTSVAESAYRTMVERLHLDRRETLFDLYAGVGTIGMVASSSAYQTIGIEIVEEAVEFARDSAQANGIGNCTFRSGSVEQALPHVVRDMAKTGLTASRALVAVNPPRRGIDQGVLEQIVRLRPARLAYLSCEPRTLVRDLKYLTGHDFALRHVELFDMFPYTPKVETLAIIERRRPMIAVTQPRNQRHRTR
ncbi:MAG: 23S rRNA (uracil(1939)-C(5))-methyltransferase RlmD [Phycisphaerae bacterium]